MLGTGRLWSDGIMAQRGEARRKGDLCARDDRVTQRIGDAIAGDVHLNLRLMSVKKQARKHDSISVAMRQNPQKSWPIRAVTGPSKTRCTTRSIGASARMHRASARTTRRWPSPPSATSPSTSSNPPSTSASHGAPGAAGGPGSRTVSRMARMYATKPSVPTNKGQKAAQWRTRSISRRIRAGFILVYGIATMDKPVAGITSGDRSHRVR